jgi:hypothetical protein
MLLAGFIEAPETGLQLFVLNCVTTIHQKKKKELSEIVN